MSPPGQDESTCDSDPLKIEHDSKNSQERLNTSLEQYLATAELFVNEPSSSSSNSSQSAETEVSMAHDACGDVDIEPHHAVSVEFEDSPLALEIAQSNSPNSKCTSIVNNWPVLEITPGGFKSNAIIDDDFSTHTTVAPAKSIEKETTSTPQIDIPTYILMGHQRTYFEGHMKLYCCGKCDESFDFMYELTRHLKTHLPSRGREDENKKRALDEQFIDLVRQHSCLWDHESLHYRDGQVKDDAWREIVGKCDVGGINNAKCRWNNLRDIHRDIVKNQRNKSGECSRPWKYMDKMKFLLPYRFASGRKKKYTSRTAATDESFIKCVRGNPCLWDKTLECYKDFWAKEEAWSAVVTECNMEDVQTAKNKWKNLRDIHRDVLKKQKFYTDDDSSKSCKSWRYMKLMQFLPPYRHNKKVKRHHSAKIEVLKKICNEKEYTQRNVTAESSKHIKETKE